MTDSEMMEFNSKPRSRKWDEVKHLILGYWYRHTKLESGRIEEELTTDDPPDGIEKFFYEPIDNAAMVFITEWLEEVEIIYANIQRKKYNVKPLEILAMAKSCDYIKFDSIREKILFIKNEFSESNISIDINKKISQGIKYYDKNMEGFFE